MSQTGDDAGGDNRKPVPQQPPTSDQKSVELLPVSEYEGLARTAERIESVDPGSGSRFIRAVIEDYERQGALQEREQAYYENEQKVRHRHSTAALIVASAIAVAAVGFGIYCAVNGDIACAAVLLAGPLAAIIGALLKVRVTRQPAARRLKGAPQQGSAGDPLLRASVRC